MSATSPAAVSRTSASLLPSLALALCLAAARPVAASPAGMDSVALFRYTRPVRMELLLPFDGPGADRSVAVDFAPRIWTGSVLADSPSRRWGLFGSVALGADYDPAYWEDPLPGWDAGPYRGYLPRLGARYRPVPQASLSLERVWNSH